jgi:hypothetical protein
MPVTIRPATAADLPQAGVIYYRAEVRDDPNPPPPHPLGWLAHALATGQMYVADADGVLLGYAARIVRASVAYLTDLFVRAERQSDHIGTALLEITMPPGEQFVQCTMSSTDPRAQSLYIRSGMRPRWPNFWLRGMSATLGALPTSDIRVVEAARDDPEFVVCDTRISGRRRPEDFAYWLTETRAVPLWLERDGAQVGYAVVQRRSDASIWYPDGFTVGPVGAQSEEDAAECVLAAVAWACARASVVRVAVPGPHRALKPLLDARFRINYVETFCSAAADTFFDPCRYVSSGDLL